ncbi:hypothetical protein OG21DRAFT_1517623 [Imleria badia]|nr:hypothetical protein OG21DRAFT_1517623 [Imleria badia]
MLQHKSAPSKVAEKYRWLVILSSREHMDELRRAPDDELSLVDARHNVWRRVPR